MWYNVFPVPPTNVICEVLSEVGKKNGVQQSSND